MVLLYQRGKKQKVLLIKMYVLPCQTPFLNMVSDISFACSQDDDNNNTFFG
jgi:hypothetical protein